MGRINKSVGALVGWFLAPARAKSAFEDTKFMIVTIAVLGVWLAGVIFTATRHEFWRDEVRALSLARAAVSPLDLYRLTQYEGHPILWYLLLYIGNAIFNTPLVLPITGIIIAFAFVCLFMFYSPFPFLVKVLFIFSALPFYEYSVMARNYGISALLLFICAKLYRDRARHPFLLGLVLALLANTNVHSAIFTCLIAGLWAWEAFVKQKASPATRRWFATYVPFFIVVLGLLLSAMSAMPRENTILTPVRRSLSLRAIASATFYSTLLPNRIFPRLFPSFIPSYISLVICHLAVFALLPRFPLFTLAFAGQIALGILFRVVYGGDYRHQGLFLIFLVFLYWLALDSTYGEAAFIKRKWPSLAARILKASDIGIYVAMVALILGNMVLLRDKMWADIRREMSSSKAFGEYLKGSVVYQDAIIVPEPDFLLESLPYYADNKIYLPREHRFGTTVSWTTEANVRLSLGELLQIARDVQARYGWPVLIVFGHWDMDEYDTNEKKYSYNKVFSWSPLEIEDLDKSTVLVATFKYAYTDENYRVYTMR